MKPTSYEQMHMAVQLGRLSITLWRIIAAVCFTSLLVGSVRYRFRSFHVTQVFQPKTHACKQSGPTNKTLGFGAIYVVTEDVTTWRVQGLLQAAQSTDLELQINVQEHLPEDELRSRAGPDELEKSCATHALVHHISLLETFLRSSHETVLIVEDDVDFGKDIKSQMAIISQTILGRTNPDRSLPKDPSHPYGEDDWDLLWLGHYGIQFVPGTLVTPYKDPFALPWDCLTSPFNDYYRQMAVSSTAKHPHWQQLVDRVAPYCPFAYAITRSYARRLVDRLRYDRVQVYDEALHSYCINHAQRCLAPVPEIFHRHRVVSNGQTSQKGIVNASEDMAWCRGVYQYTHNIEWSARCNAAEVGEQVEDLWQCLPEKHDDLV